MTRRIVYLKTASVGRDDLPDMPGGMQFVVTREDGDLLTLLRERDQATFTAPAELFDTLTYDRASFAGTLRYIFARLLNPLPEELEGAAAFQRVQPDVRRLRQKLEIAYNLKSNLTHAQPVALHQLSAWAADQIDAGQSVKNIVKMTNGKLLKQARKQGE